MSGHTPGPWLSHDVVDGLSDDIGLWVVDIPDDAEATVHRLYFGDMENNTGRDIANARIVAAAPDLLDACRLAREWLYGNDAAMGIDVLDRVEKAIAKATGADR